MIKLFFIGKDKRTKYLKELYEKENKVTENLENANYIIFTIPITKDGTHITGEDILIDEIIPKCKNKTIFSGGIASDIKRKFEKYNVECIDLMQLDEIAILNAIPTAEGAILKSMEVTEKTIHGSNVLVLGYGRTGKILADKLKGLNANVFCEARSKKDLALIKALGYNVVELENLDKFLSDMDIIYSTIPSIVLDEKRLKLLKKDAVVIDIASNPGSVDYDKANELGIKAYLELGIPSKVAPASAAEYLKEAIDNIIK